MLKRLISFFKNTKADSHEPEFLSDGAAYYHEDLFRQVEFVPRERLNELRLEHEKLNGFVATNSDGFGFKDIYVREDRDQILLFDKQITVQDIDTLLLKFGMRKIETVYYFYSTAKFRSENTFAYELHRAQIFVVVENDFVKDCFVDRFRFQEAEEDRLELENLLFEIGTCFNLILNDWDIQAVIDLENRNEIKKYLNEEL